MKTVPVSGEDPKQVFAVEDIKHEVSIEEIL